ncbi:MAG: helix-turn-helix domain-containing protein [Candidatus Bathyarchaeia archaeon]
MCGGECKEPCPKEFNKLQKYFRALHCPTRWTILSLLGDKTRSTNEIFEELKDLGENLSRSGLYYHLSELEEAGIIELAEYREVGGGAPEKTWKLKTKEIKINLLTDLPKASNYER